MIIFSIFRSSSFQVLLDLHNITCLRSFQYSATLQLFPVKQNFMFWPELHVMFLLPAQSQIIQASQGVFVLIMIGRDSYSVTLASDNDQQYETHKVVLTP